jgi:hypothetical protein
MSDDLAPIALENGYTLHPSWTGGAFYADALWTNDLDEDDEGNWAFPGELLNIDVIAPNGERVGGADFSYLANGHGGHLACFNIALLDAHQRKGLATALYDCAEEIFGDTVLPYPGNEGGAIQRFWLNRLKDEPSLLRRYADNIGVRDSEIDEFLDQQNNAGFKR